MFPIRTINEIFRTIPQKSPSPLPLNKRFADFTKSSKSPPHLPPLSKGGGLTARHKLLLCCVLLEICPLFLYCKLFCRQDGGIAIPPFAQYHIYASLVKGEVLSPERIRATTGGIATPPSLACTNPPEPALSLSLFVGRGSVCACMVLHPCKT